MMVVMMMMDDDYDYSCSCIIMMRLLVTILNHQYGKRRRTRNAWLTTARNINTHQHQNHCPRQHNRKLRAAHDIVQLTTHGIAIVRIVADNRELQQ